MLRSVRQAAREVITQTTSKPMLITPAKAVLGLVAIPGFQEIRKFHEKNLRMYGIGMVMVMALVGISPS